MALLSEAAHRLAVLAHAIDDQATAAFARLANIASGDFDARRHALDVPLPRAGQSLVKVVGTEDEPPVLGGESAEVGDVGIPARLHDDPGVRRGGEVRRHHRRRPPVEREGGDEHPPIPDGHELLDPGRRLCLKHGDGVRSVRSGRPLAVGRARRQLPGGSAAFGRLA